MCVLMEAGNCSTLIHASGSSSSTRSWFYLTFHFLGVLLLPWAGSVYKDSAVQCGWHSQEQEGPGVLAESPVHALGRKCRSRCVWRRGTHGCAPAGAAQLPAGYSPCSVGERKPSAGPRTDDENLLSVSQTRVVSHVQKGIQCYVWEGQHFQSRIWCNGNYPKLFLLVCSKISSQLLHSCVNPLVYPHGVSWTISKLQGLGDA